MPSDSISFCRAYRSIISKNIHRMHMTSWKEMVLVEDWPSKPSFHTDRLFQTRKVVLLGREGSNPCIGMWHGTCKQSCFVEGELDSTWSLWKHSESMWWERSCWLERHDELTRQWFVWTSELNRDIASVMCRFGTRCDIKDSTSDFDIKKEEI